MKKLVFKQHYNEKEFENNKMKIYVDDIQFWTNKENFNREIWINNNWKWKFKQVIYIPGNALLPLIKHLISLINDNEN